MFSNPHLIKSSNSYSKSCKSTTDNAVPVNYQETPSLSINPSSPRKQKATKTEYNSTMGTAN